MRSKTLARARIACVPQNARVGIGKLFFAPLAINLLTAGCDVPTTSSSSKHALADDAPARGAEITERMLKVYRNAKAYADHGAYTEQSAYRGEGVERQLPFFQMSL